MPADFYINSPSNRLPENHTIEILKASNALEFHLSLSEYQATPLLELPGLAKKHNVGRIYVKDESRRFGLNAFKALGASFAIHQSLLKNPRITTFCTATDGNHGLAVAWSAQRNGKKSLVIVPETTTKQRIKAIEKAGAIVIQIQGNYDAACRVAEQHAQSEGFLLMQDVAWEGYLEIPAWIVAGYLTMFRELEDSLHTAERPRIDVVFLQAGVGSMAAAGIFYYLNRYRANRPNIIIVEPREADGVLYSFQQNKISTSTGNSQTIMAGLNCETPSLGAWDLLKNGVDYSIRIKDIYAKRAMQDLYFPTGTDSRLISGESGAAGLAGFLAIQYDQSLKPVQEKLNLNERSNLLFINTEGDTDEEMFNKIINEK